MRQQASAPFTSEGPRLECPGAGADQPSYRQRAAQIELQGDEPGQATSGIHKGLRSSLRLFF